MSVTYRTHRPDLAEPIKPPPQPVGLGDAVARVAQPIAYVIDRLAGTQIQRCGGCKSRQDALNRAVPDLRHPFQG